MAYCLGKTYNFQHFFVLVRKGQDKVDCHTLTIQNGTWRYEFSLQIPTASFMVQFHDKIWISYSESQFSILKTPVAWFDLKMRQSGEMSFFETIESKVMYSGTFEHLFCSSCTGILYHLYIDAGIKNKNYSILSAMGLDSTYHKVALVRSQDKIFLGSG